MLRELRYPSANIKQELMLGTVLSHSSAAPRSNSGRLRHIVLIMTFSMPETERYTDLRCKLEEEPVLLRFRLPFQASHLVMTK